MQLAYGTEQGRIGIVRVEVGGDWEGAEVRAVRGDLGPERAVTCLRWRPGFAEEGGRLLAVASEDGGVRLVRIS